MMIGSHDEALDISQEAFVRAYRAIAKFQASRAGFLRGIIKFYATSVLIFYAIVRSRRAHSLKLIR